VPEPCPVESYVFNQKWDGKTITSGTPPWKEACLYKTVTYRDISFEMCIRNFPDIVSEVISRPGGRWGDCDVLIDLWNENPRATENVKKHNPEGIFVDAGANIGACTLLMAAAGHATFGFEPSRKNLYYLTAGILANRKEVRDKVTVYQLGLGTHTQNVSAFVANGNAGNTVLETQVKDWPTQTFDEEIFVPVAPLDDILWPDPTSPPPHIKVLKMDVQGYEVKILKGAKRLLEAGAIGIVKSELTEMFLQGQGSSAMEMLSLLYGHGFELHDKNGNPVAHSAGVSWGEVVLRRKMD